MFQHSSERPRKSGVQTCLPCVWLKHSLAFLGPFPRWDLQPFGPSGVDWGSRGRCGALSPGCQGLVPCQAGILALGACGAGHCVARARPDLPLPPHKCTQNVCRLSLCSPSLLLIQGMIQTPHPKATAKNWHHVRAAQPRQCP